MKLLWNVINELRIRKLIKNILFLNVLILINFIVGSVTWFIVGRFLLIGLTELVCFMGYPAVLLGFFGGVIYLYNNEMA